MSSRNFKKESVKIDDSNDISLVNPEIESKSKLSLAMEILSDAIFNIYPMLLFFLLETLNLIFIGHIKDEYDRSRRHSYFNFFQIGVIYINLFGFVYSLGAIKSLHSATNRLKHYLKLKMFIYFLILIVIIPLAVSSYWILQLIYSDGGASLIADEHIWFVFKEFIVYSPAFIFLQLMFHLNLKVFELKNMRVQALGISLLFLFMHSILSYIFIFLWNLNIKGVVLSLILTSGICYVFSNMNLPDDICGSVNGNYYFIPNKIKIDDEFFNALADTLLSGVIPYFQYAGFGFFLLFSYFVDEVSLTTNIVLLNFFSLLHYFGQGFSTTLKNYIMYSSIGNKHSHPAKKKYVKVFSIVVLTTAFVFALIILTFGGTLIRIYLRDANPKIEEKFNNISYFYAVVIFFDYISEELEGYVKGINVPNHISLYKSFFLIIFLPLGLILCFSFGFGIMGFWLGTYLYIIIYTILNGIQVYKYYELFFQK